MQKRRVVMMAWFVGLVVSCGPGEEEPVTEQPAATCSMDAECKGARICQSGACVDPAVMQGDMGVTPDPVRDMGSGPGPVQDMAPSSQATCATACAKVESCYPGQASMAECVAGCEQNLTQAQRTCVTNAATCPDADQCFMNAGPDPDPEPDTTCIDAVQCMASQYCWYPEGAFEGECQTNDFGKSCQSSSECAHRLCVFDSNVDDFGECTRECTASSECPESWTCKAPSAGANFNSNFCDR